MRAYLKIFIVVIGIVVTVLGVLTIWGQLQSGQQVTNKIKYGYKDLAVGFIGSGSESSWRAAYYTSFRETAMALGSTFIHTERSVAGDRFAIEDFQRFIKAPKVNVIVIGQPEVPGWRKLFQEAREAGKIVILSWNRVDVPENLYSTFVGSDFVEERRTAGREMCKLLEGSEKKYVWELTGTEGSGAAIDRGTGFREMVAQCGIVIANSQTGNFIKTVGKQVIEAWLKESRDVLGIFAQNDDMGLGAIEALKEADLAPAVDVKIVSIDASAGAFQAMLKGDLNVTVECNPWLAPQVYEAALAALNGETLPKWIPAKESVFHMDDPNLQEIATL